jgi:release factor glutamine methyltransferase
MTYDAALATARGALADAGITSAAIDARLLMAAAADIDMAALISRARDPLPALARARFDAHLTRRLGGEPVARILGEKEFWGLRFEIGAATLVPRPETETLVACVLERARRRKPDIAVCDLGTGSGAILAALLKELPQAHGTGTDMSAAALDLARRNAERHGVANRVTFEQVAFADGPRGPFDVVVSNPPYVRSAAIPCLERDVREFDPRVALDGGADGLDAFRAILARADVLVAEGGIAAFETGHDQADEVADLCRAHGLVNVEVRNDLSGAGRVVVADAGAGTGLWRKKRLEKRRYAASFTIRTRADAEETASPYGRQRSTSPIAGSLASPSPDVSTVVSSAGRETAGVE